jgi:hypothetical protein
MRLLLYRRRTVMTMTMTLTKQLLTWYVYIRVIYNIYEA